MTKDERARHWDRIQEDENRQAQKPRADAVIDRMEGRDNSVNRAETERHERAADYAAEQANAIRKGKK